MSSLRPLADYDSCWPACGHGGWDGSLHRDFGKSQDPVLSTSQRGVLSHTIEAEIIPRLLLAHAGTAVASREQPELSMPGPEDVEEFVRILVIHDLAVAQAFVTAIRSYGIPLDAVFLGLFAPAARRLGELWKQDICDFADVTIALSRLQRLLRELAPEFDGDVEPRPGARRALLVAAPGEQHTFGIFVVQEFFRRAGWDVCGGIHDTAEELISVARSEPFDVVGLSISCDVSIESLASLIRTIRRGASNSALQIMVGGRFFLEHPELVKRVGADATAQDGRRAVPQLSSLLDTNAMRY